MSNGKFFTTQELNPIIRKDILTNITVRLLEKPLLPHDEFMVALGEDAMNRGLLTMTMNVPTGQSLNYMAGKFVSSIITHLNERRGHQTAVLVYPHIKGSIYVGFQLYAQFLSLPEAEMDTVIERVTKPVDSKVEGLDVEDTQEDMLDRLTEEASRS